MMDLKGLWYANRAKRKAAGKPPLTFEEYLAFRREKEADRAFRDKPAQEIGILSRKAVKAIETEADGKYLLDHMSRQEDGSRFHRPDYDALGAGCFWKSKKGPSV